MLVRFCHRLTCLLAGLASHAINASLTLAMALVWFSHYPRAGEWLGHVVTTAISLHTGADFSMARVDRSVELTPARLTLTLREPTWKTAALTATATRLTLTIAYDGGGDVYLARFDLDAPHITLTASTDTLTTATDFTPWPSRLSDHLGGALAMLGRAKVTIHDATLTQGALQVQASPLTVTPDDGALRLASQLIVEQHSLRLPLLVSGKLAPEAIALDAALPHADYKGHRLSAFTARLAYDPTVSQGTLNAKGLINDARIGFMVPFTLQSLSVQLAPTVTLPTLSYPALMALWPESLAANPRAWMAENLRAGIISDLSAGATITLSRQGLNIADLQGGMTLSDFDAQYIAGMDWISDIHANATFTEDTFTILLDSGHSNGVTITGGTLLFRDFEAPVSYLDIDVTLSGSLPDALALIDQKPLGYAGRFGLTPSATAGTVITQLFMTLPLLKTLEFEDISLEVTSTLQGVRLPVPDSDVLLTNGELTLSVTPEEAALTGTARLNDMTGDLTWRTAFRKNADAQEQATFTTRLSATDLAIFVPEALLTLADTSARLPLELSFVRVASGEKTIRFTIDTLETPLALPVLGWRKPDNQSARLEAILIGTKNGGWRVEPLRLSSGVESLEARLTFDAEWILTRAVASSVRLGDAKLDSLRYAANAEEYSLTIAGESLRLNLDALETLTDDDADNTSGSVTITLGNLLLSDAEQPLQDFTLSAREHSGQWQTLDAAARIGDATLTARIEPRDSRTRYITLTTSNAGAVLEGIGVTDSLLGGEAILTGTLNRFDQLNSLLTMRDFRVKNLPLLARLLSLASLTAPLDFLSGDGLPFSRLQGGLYYRDDVLSLNDMRMTGTSLGLHASGDINLANDTLALDGAILPAYMLTDVVGSIPILGDILTSGKKEGILALRFNATGNRLDPSVTVNPLSALAPGFLRKFFDIFDKPVVPTPPEP